MPWTEQDRDKLKKAIAIGAKTVAYADRRVEYRSLDEMLGTLAMMEEELAPKKRRGRLYMSGSSGVRS